MKKPFSIKKRSIRTTLKGFAATVTREVQTGILPLGTPYKKASWWVKFDHSECASGPWSKKQIRTCFSN